MTRMFSRDNPIENAFAKRKRLLGPAAERTVEGLGQTIERFAPTECRNDFRHGGDTATDT